MRKSINNYTPKGDYHWRNEKHNTILDYSFTNVGYVYSVKIKNELCEINR